MSPNRADGAILCVGRVYCDLVFLDAPRLPSFGTEIFADGLSLHAGGGAYITAAYLAGLGRTPKLCAYLPAAPFGGAIEVELRNSGIDTTLCQPGSDAEGAQITVVIPGCENGQEDRAFLTRRSGDAHPPIIQNFAAKRALHLHVGELSTLIENPQLLEFARDNGQTISLDCGWDERLTAQDIGDLIEKVDVFLPNQAEADWLASIGVSLAEVPLCIVKQGALGVSARRNGAEVERHQGTPVAMVDATGAGDAFNAGFLDLWLADAPLAECLAAGHACGAAAVQHPGGTGGVAQIRAGLVADNTWMTDRRISR